MFRLSLFVMLAASAFCNQSDAQIFRRLFGGSHQVCEGNCATSATVTQSVVQWHTVQPQESLAVVQNLPTLAPPLPSVDTHIGLAAESKAIESSEEQNNAAFRRSLITVSREALHEGKINRLEFSRIVVSSLMPQRLAQLRAVATENAVSEGLIPVGATPDWNAFLAFLKELIPIILEIIKMFT
jgi:hypothetical protein